MKLDGRFISVVQLLILKNRGGEHIGSDHRYARTYLEKP